MNVITENATRKLLSLMEDFGQAYAAYPRLTFLIGAVPHGVAGKATIPRELCEARLNVKDRAVCFGGMGSAWVQTGENARGYFFYVAGHGEESAASARNKYLELSIRGGAILATHPVCNLDAAIEDSPQGLWQLCLIRQLAGTPCALEREGYIAIQNPFRASVRITAELLKNWQDISYTLDDKSKSPSTKKAHANNNVQEHLLNHPGSSIRAVSAKTGLSTKIVGETGAWKHEMKRRNEVKPPSVPSALSLPEDADRLISDCRADSPADMVATTMDTERIGKMPPEEKDEIMAELLSQLPLEGREEYDCAERKLVKAEDKEGLDNLRTNVIAQYLDDQANELGVYRKP